MTTTTTHEPYQHAACRPLAPRAARITGGFWKRIVDRSRNHGLPALLAEYEQRNVVGNFIATAAGKPRAGEENARNYDEFLYKALEACCYHLAHAPADDPLAITFQRLRAVVGAAQQPDGYLNTLAIQSGATRHSTQTHQELYAGGHLMQAGLAERAATGESTLFDAGRRYLDCLIAGYGLDGGGFNRFWGTEKWPDHPNVELALVELYRATGERRYLRFCDAIWRYADYRQRTQMTNHAVQEVLHAAGGADYFLETGDVEVWAATERLWRDMLKKVYVTGGIGSTDRGTGDEAVGKQHGLTNDQSYAETCAAIAMVLWSWRMFLATGDGKYTDMLERALYNGVLAGISLDGGAYFYENPLEYRVVTASGSAALEDRQADFRGDGHTRKAYHDCSCCPPNVHRLLASLHQYIYATDGTDVWVNLFVESEAQLPLDDGTQLHLQQRTGYPWDGRIELAIDVRAATGAPAATGVELALRVRVPRWCETARITVNDRALTPAVERGHAVIRRRWTDGDRLLVELPLEVRLVRSHPQNVANYAKLVLARGPLVYAVEAVDHAEVDIFALAIAADSAWHAQRREPELDDAIIIEGEAVLRDDSAWDAQPYQTYRGATDLSGQPTGVALTAIPYFAWANRGRSSMLTALPLATH